MLSRVHSAGEGDVQPVVWRSSGSGASRPPAGPSAAARTPSPAAAGIQSVPDPDFEAKVQQQLQTAFDSGFREGESAARKQLENEVRRSAEQLGQTAAELAATRGEVMRRAEADVLQLSMEIARRILHRELSVDPLALTALVRAALEKLASQQVSRVRVHADQEQLVRACLTQLGRGAEIEVVADTTQTRGGAVFETDSGSLDASVETQLREIERGFADRLQERA